MLALALRAADERRRGGRSMGRACHRSVGIGVYRVNWNDYYDINAFLAFIGVAGLLVFSVGIGIVAGVVRLVRWLRGGRQ